MTAQIRYDIRAIANWILDEADRRKRNLSNMAINKIAYFIVEKAIVEADRVITDAKIEAWQHGPVFREIYHAFKNHGDESISSRACKFDSKSRTMIKAEEHFLSQDESIFKSALDNYINLSAAQLRALSHQENGPWHRVWWHEGHLNPGMEISLDVIRQSFDRSKTHHG